MENHDKIRYMQALENGVIFFPPVGNKAAMCTIDENDKIQSKLLTYYSIFEVYDFINMKELKNNFNIYKVLIFDVILILIPTILKSANFLIVTAFFSLFISRDFFMLLKIIYEMKSKKGTAKTTAKFVAACNMVTNAYNDLERIPTLEEVKTYSRYSYYSGIADTFKSIIKKFIFLITYILIGLNINPGICFIIAISFLFFINYLFEHGYLTSLQILVTCKPSDKELEVAIEGIKFYDDILRRIWEWRYFGIKKQSTKVKPNC